MKTKLMALFLALAALTLIWGCGEKLGNDVVMVVDGDEMTTDEFRNLALRRFGGEMMLATQTREAMDNYVTEVLEGELKAADGRAKGYANRPEVMSSYEEARNMAAIGELYNRTIVDSLIPEDSLKSYYDRDGFEVNASHILIRIDEDTDSVQAHDAIVEIRKEILDNNETVDSTAFSNAALENSEDTNSQNGELNWFRRGEMVPSFENVAFATEPGHMSDPVYTPFGWHLIFTHEIRAIPDRPTYEEDKERIKQLAMREHGQELVDMARQFVKDLETERDVEFQMDNINKVYNIVEPRQPAADPFSFLTEEQLEWDLVTFDEGSFTAGDLKPYVQRHMANRKFEDAEMVKAIVENYITEKVLLPDDAKKRGFLSLPEVLEQAKMAADIRIRQIVNQDINEIPESTDEDLQAYFNEHMEDYMLDAQYTLIEVFLEDREMADSVKAMAERGDKSLKELAVEYTTRPGVKEKDGIFGPIRKAQYGAIGRNAAEAEIGELVGPLRVQGKWSVFKVISKEEPKADEFENVKDKVSVDWRAWMRETRKTTYMDSIKSAIDWQLNKRAIDITFPHTTWAGEGGNDSSAG
ncbi:peptidylprolyl isomerase [bacterium]|nr:peptidylprolyl isomerase [bacterium]